MTRTASLALVIAGVLATPLLAAAAPKNTPRPRAVELADVAAGTYQGDVISDSRGSSQSDVTLTVEKVGPNKVTVSSSYARLPKFTVGLTRVMNTVQAANGYSTNFLLDLSRTPRRLDINVDGASWSGEKR